MELPMLDFLKEKNCYTGSVGDFRYKIQPSEEGMQVWTYRVYSFDYCQEHGLIQGEASFPLDQEGMEAMGQWLKEQQAAAEE